MVDEGYTEYGYRGDEEIRQANEKIAKLEQRIKELEEQIKNEDTRHTTPDKYTKKGTWIKDGVLMCSKECCGAPVSECSWIPSCKKCNCYNLKEDGRIVPGVNTTVDVKTGETERQAAKFLDIINSYLKREMQKIHTLYNLGLVNESADIVWERVVKQSDPITVLNKVMDRADNSAFPVRMYDGSTIGVTPNTAKRIIDVYDNLEDEKKKKVEWYLRTKNGFKELAQLVGAIAKPTVARVSGALTDHVEEAWSQSYKKSIDCSNPKGFSQKSSLCRPSKKANK